MSTNWLKNDWSLSYFLYYISRISAWLYILLILVQLTTTVTMFTSEGRYMALLQNPVSINVEDFSESSAFETNSAKGFLVNRVEGTVNAQKKQCGTGRLPAHFARLF